MAVGAPIYASLPTLTSGDGVTWTASINVGSATSDNCLFVTAYHEDGKTITSMLWDGGASTGQMGSTNIRYWTAPATGTKTLTVVLNAYSSVKPLVMIALFENVDQGSPVGSLVSGSLPSTTPSTGSVTCPSGGTVYGVLVHTYSTAAPTLTSGTAAGSPSSAYTASSWGFAHAYRESTGAISWSTTNSGSANGVVLGVPINAASGGGGSTSDAILSPKTARILLPRLMSH